MDPLEIAPELFWVMAGLLGLMVGSFLNVVIHRLPIMLEKAWRRDCEVLLGQDPQPPEYPVFNLLMPGSHCPQCGKPVAVLENIPVISFLLLGGRCSGCHAGISWRYPVVETLTAILSVIVAWRFGATVQAAAALVLTWSLIALSFIDLDRQLLPDVITLPMLWLGLLLSVFTVFEDSSASIVGAVCGYLILWLVYQVFKLLTGRVGMGYGDFKLLAMLGAWLGWSRLPMIVLMSSLVGAVVGLLMILIQQRDHRIPIPFGPFLALAGWVALLWGDQLNTAYLGLMSS